MLPLDGARHILLGGEPSWIRLHSIKRAPPGDFTVIDVRLDGAKHMMRRIDTATQLLSLYRSTGDKISLVGRRKSARQLIEAITAYDLKTLGNSPKIKGLVLNRTLSFSAAC